MREKEARELEEMRRVKNEKLSLQNYEEFKKQNVEILQLSADPLPAIKAWVEQLGGMPYPLCSDYWPHGATGKAYGIFNEEKGFDKRAAYVLDGNGVRRTIRFLEQMECTILSGHRRVPPFGLAGV